MAPRGRRRSLMGHMVLLVPDATPTQRLAATLLGESLALWVATRRGQGKSWKTIADDLSVSTDGQVNVNRETLRAWYRQEYEDVG